MAIRTSSVVVLLLLVFLSTHSLQVQDEIILIHQQQQTPFFHCLRNWFNINTLFTSLFPPDIDFRGRIKIRSSDDEIEEGRGTGDKVKEAVAMSVDQGKATVEKSAKSAAKKLKEAFSHEL